MIFETLNSVYRVDVREDGQFDVTKIEELKDSSFNAVGVPRVSPFMSIQVGQRAIFDGWSTSRVTKIRQQPAREAQ